MRFNISLLFIATLSLPAVGDDVPFAVPSASRLGSPSQAYYASLGDIMSLVQTRHMKLWQAGNAKNWSMASFEIEQIRETFGRAAMFYEHLPIADVLSVERPLVDLARASKTRDPVAFTKSFSSLTTACNGCHHAASVGFVEIITPTSSPFTDQRF